MWERRKGVTLWIRFGGRSLSRLLMGLEAYARAPSVLAWGNFWEEEVMSLKLICF